MDLSTLRRPQRRDIQSFWERSGEHDLPSASLENEFSERFVIERFRDDEIIGFRFGRWRKFPTWLGTFRRWKQLSVWLTMLIQRWADFVTFFNAMQICLWTWMKWIKKNYDRLLKVKIFFCWILIFEWTLLNRFKRFIHCGTTHDKFQP